MPQAKPVEIYIPQLQTNSMVFNILGTTPIICNRMSDKAQRMLLGGGGKKTEAEKKSSLKHNPPQEFRDSPYRIKDPNCPSWIAFPSGSFKASILSAALDTPGVKKAQVGRLAQVKGEYIPVFGKPYLFMSIVRSADINRTPDIRTRAILPRWACQIEVSWIEPLLNAQAIASLLSNAGVLAGVGDWRPEKGKGVYGSFRIVTPDDPDLKEVLGEGREVQLNAMNRPEAYDEESEALLKWWTETVTQQGKMPATEELTDKAAFLDIAEEAEEESSESNEEEE
jgi:hypothetical protein